MQMVSQFGAVVIDHREMSQAGLTSDVRAIGNKAVISQEAINKKKLEIESPDGNEG
jgi:hypothetical protein